jgi:hypothetical protein
MRTTIDPTWLLYVLREWILGTSDEFAYHEQCRYYFSGSRCGNFCIDDVPGRLKITLVSISNNFIYTSDIKYRQSMENYCTYSRPLFSCGDHFVPEAVSSKASGTKIKHFTDSGLTNQQQRV